eukprot:14102592-Heterocapsa_arctica.AAC.1
MLKDSYIWIDYCSLPQLGLGGLFESAQAAARGIKQAKFEEMKRFVKALNSIPAYVEQSSLLLALVPLCVHHDTGE